MIGVQGAGLQWSVFMPRGCTLIEIAWPSKHWGFHFHNYVESYGITQYSLRADARVNWAAYENNVRNGTKVSHLWLRQFLMNSVFEVVRTVVMF